MRGCAGGAFAWSKASSALMHPAPWCRSVSSSACVPDHGRPVGLTLLAAAALVAGGGFWLTRTEVLWKSPVADARVESVTDFDGLESAGAISSDGSLAAFLSDRDGKTDVWVTRIGSNEFHNLTHGAAPELVNPSVRTLGFTPDGSSVTYWARRPGEKRRRGHRHLVRSDPRRTVDALSQRRGGARLVARRIPTRLPHDGPGRSDVRDEGFATPPGHGALHRAIRAACPFSALVGRRQRSTSCRARSRTNWISGG